MRSMGALQRRRRGSPQANPAAAGGRSAACHWRTGLGAFAARGRGLLFASVVVSGCGGGGGGGSGPAPAPPPPPPPPAAIVVPEVTPEERFAGGDASTSLSNEEAFGQSPPAIQSDFSADANFKSGNQIFRNAHDGEGPLLNARTCQGCHTRDGRGATPPNTETPMDSMSIRLSLGVDAAGEAIPDPAYGTLLHTFGLASFHGEGGIDAGLSAFGRGGEAAIGEGFATVEYETVAGAYDDGTAFTLRRPVITVRELSYGDFEDGILFSARIPPQLIGLGLLAAVPEADIRTNADANDADDDGISGRFNSAYDQTVEATRLGRFGHKASTASLLQQAVNAYRADMGVTSRFAIEEPCTPRQTSCQQAALAEPDDHPGGVDIDDVQLALVEFYLRLLAVPERRGYDETADSWDEEVLRGRTLFFESGCEKCHRQRWETGAAAGSVLGRVELNTLFEDVEDIAVLSEQTIFPYTDLLLHDMGGACPPISREHADGEPCPSGQNCRWVQRCTGLADGRPEGAASGGEWRTAPLWGLGLVRTVNERATFLHDGRAESIAEAILWHGGEAQASRDEFAAMAEADRDALLAFLNSL